MPVEQAEQPLLVDARRQKVELGPRSVRYAATPGEDINWLEDIELLSEDGVPAVFDRYSNSFLKIYFDIPPGREDEIARMAEHPTEAVNPLALCREMERLIDQDSVLVADGGDFVATASYVVRPRGPLRWLDPGAFGTLGVGAGFANRDALAGSNRGAG